ncbi:MAG TPA: DUF1569 domain-containing protein [Edaphobacter sp.]|nr:DUF1569 domain-containing protein [Edaphobacter sp.]
MRTLASPSVRAALIRRLERLTPTTAPLWGSMSATQMLQHLALAFQTSLTSKPEPSASRFDNPVCRFVALRLPVRWPKGIAAPALLDFSINPPPLVDFTHAYDDLVCTMHHFGQAPSSAFIFPHPVFGKLSHAQWMRWGYRHTDHHLRQFGC